MSALEATTTAEVVVRRTLDELALSARTEYQAAAEHLAGALSHFIRFGEVLLEARSRLDEAGEGWLKWLKSIGINHQFTADRAMRLAFYKDRLPSEAFQVRRDASGRVLNPSWNNALQYVSGLPPIRNKGQIGYPESTRQEAHRLHAEGLTAKEIGAILNVGASTVRYWVLPGEEQRVRENRRRYKAKNLRIATAARKQMRREERDLIAKSVGGELAVAYGHLRSCLAALDRSVANCDDITVAGVARRTISQLHGAENSLVEAMQAERGRLAGGVG